MRFEVNVGQADPLVKFLHHGGDRLLLLTQEEAIVVGRKGEAVRMRFLGGARHPEMSGEDPLEGESSYLIGRDPREWHVGVRHYGAVRYHDVYPGIDVRFHGSGGDYEHDFVVAPGADPSLIRVSFDGVESLRLDDHGDLVLCVDGHELLQRAPVVYQVGDGGEHLACGAYRLVGPRDAPEAVAFEIAAYDPGRPVVIDPVLVFSTYLGGSADDVGYATAVDIAGNAYAAGLTRSIDFPVANPYQASNRGEADAFVSKLDATGRSFVYSTYLGGSDSDAAQGLAVDASGNVYVVGLTLSSDFPLVAPYQPALLGTGDAFAAKLDPSGSSLLYATYLGGSGSDAATQVAVDGAGNAAITGETYSVDFPVLNAAQPAKAGASWPDAFITKLAPSGSALDFSTYLGGTDFDGGRDIAIGPSGDVFVVGTTLSANFPRVNPCPCGAFGNHQAWIARLDASGLPLVYSTTLGGVYDDLAHGVAVDGGSRAHVVGSTVSPAFPVVNAYQPTKRGASDAFVSTLSASGSTLLYSTFLGGDREDEATDVALDGSGASSIVGWTYSQNFPLANPIQAANAGNSDLFVTRLSASGTSLDFSTYLGGSDREEAWRCAVDGAGSVYVAGFTRSIDFPTQVPVQGSFGGPFRDAIFSKVAVSGICPSILVGPPSLPAGQRGAPYSQTLTVAGGTPPYTCSVFPGQLPPGLSLGASSGVIAGTPTTDGSYPFTILAIDAAGCTGSRPYVLVVDPRPGFFVGEGLGPANAPTVQVRASDGTPTGISYLAFGGSSFGVRVATGQLGAGAEDETLAGPGPGPSLAPHVRAFQWNGVPVSRVSFFAYGTTGHGVQVGSGDVDGDGFAEILTGAGSGPVYGPHVRGWNFDGVQLQAIGKISYIAYPTPGYGVRVSRGDVDGDGFSEILTGPGPGPQQVAQVRGWNFDAQALTPIGGLAFVAYSGGHGVLATGGDVDNDGFAEIGTAPGPGPLNPPRVRGFDYDGAPITPLPGFDVTPFATFRGASVDLSDVSLDRREDLVVGAGPDPAAISRVVSFSYSGSALVSLPNAFLPFASLHGVNVSAGLSGY